LQTLLISRYFFVIIHFVQKSYLETTTTITWDRAIFSGERFPYAKRFGTAENEQNFSDN